MSTGSSHVSSKTREILCREASHHTTKQSVAYMTRCVHLSMNRTWLSGDSGMGMRQMTHITPTNAKEKGYLRNILQRYKIIDNRRMAMDCSLQIIDIL